MAVGAREVGPQSRHCCRHANPFTFPPPMLLSPGRKRCKPWRYMQPRQACRAKSCLHLFIQVLSRSRQLRRQHQACRLRHCRSRDAAVAAPPLRLQLRHRLCQHSQHVSQSRNQAPQRWRPWTMLRPRLCHHSQQVVVRFLAKKNRNGSRTWRQGWKPWQLQFRQRVANFRRNRFVKMLTRQARRQQQTCRLRHRRSRVAAVAAPPLRMQWLRHRLCHHSQQVPPIRTIFHAGYPETYVV